MRVVSELSIPSPCGAPAGFDWPALIGQATAVVCRTNGDRSSELPLRRASVDNARTASNAASYFSAKKCAESYCGYIGEKWHKCRRRYFGRNEKVNTASLLDVDPRSMGVVSELSISSPCGHRDVKPSRCESVEV
jgi:hypothetical protein